MALFNPAKLSQAGCAMPETPSHHHWGFAGSRKCVGTLVCGEWEDCLVRGVLVIFCCSCLLSSCLKTALYGSICLLGEQIAWSFHDHHLPPGFLWQAGFRTSTPGIGLRWVSYLLYFGTRNVPPESRHVLTAQIQNVSKDLLTVAPSGDHCTFPHFDKYIYTCNGHGLSEDIYLVRLVFVIFWCSY